MKDLCDKKRIFKTSFHTIAFLFFIYFFDLMGIVFAFILLSPWVLESSTLSFLTIVERNILIGALLATYPIGQFLSAPILGSLSDRYGRRPILLFSCFITGLAFCLTGYSLVIDQVWLIFLSRFIAGLSAGNMSVSQVAVIDVVEEEYKGRVASIFSTLGGLAWTIGPFIVLFFSNSKWVSWFSYNTPFWILGIIFLLFSVYLYFFYHSKIVARQKAKLNIKDTYRELLSVIKYSSVYYPLLISIVVMVGWMMYQGFLATYLIERFHFTQGGESIAYAVSSLAWFFGGLTSTFFFLRWVSARHLLYPSLIISALAVLSFSWIQGSNGVWVLVSISNYMQAITTGCFFVIFTQVTPLSMQGKVFGCWSGGLAFGSAISPLIAGFLIDININLPFIIAGSILLLMSVFFIKHLHVMK